MNSFERMERRNPRVLCRSGQIKNLRKTVYPAAAHGQVMAVVVHEGEASTSRKDEETNLNTAVKSLPSDSQDLPA